MLKKCLSREAKNNKIFFFSLLLIGTLAVLHYSVLLNCPYEGDDWLNSSAGLGNYYLTGQSIGAFSCNIARNWIASGRFYPFAFFIYSIFTVFNTLTAYRWFLFIYTAITVIIAGALLQKLTNNYRFSLLFLGVAPVAFYMACGKNCNPLISFHGLIQQTLLFCLLSALFVLNWIDTKKKRYAVLSCLCYVISLGTYEIAYLLIIFLLFVILYRETNLKRVAYYLAPLCITWLLMLAIYIIVKCTATNSGYVGTEISFSLQNTLRTIFIMLASAFPIYGGFPPSGFPFSVLTAADVIISVAFATLSILPYYIIRSDTMSKRNRIVIYMLGLCLWILPALLIGISKRYQEELTWGTSWLPQFIEVIGVSILFVRFCMDCYDAVQSSTCWKWLKHVFSIGLFCLVAFIVLWNRQVGASSIDPNGMKGFYTIQHAFEYNIAADVRDSDIVHAIPTVISENEADKMYSRFAQKPVYAEPMYDTSTTLASLYAQYSREYTTFCGVEQDKSFFMLGLSELNYNYMSYPLIYIEAEESEIIMFQTLENGMTETIMRPISSLQVVSSGVYGAVYKLDYQKIDYRSVQFVKQTFTIGELALTGDYTLEEDRAILHPGATQYGPYTSLPTGTYQVEIVGENLEQGVFDVVTNQGAKEIELSVSNISYNVIVYEFILVEQTNMIEFRLFNQSTQDIYLKNYNILYQ